MFFITSGLSSVPLEHRHLFLFLLRGKSIDKVFWDINIIYASEGTWHVNSRGFLHQVSRWQ
eukprot:c27573_g1_i1 orf=133-315(-)